MFVDSGAGVEVNNIREETRHVRIANCIDGDTITFIPTISSPRTGPLEIAGRIELTQEYVAVTI